MHSQNFKHHIHLDPAPDGAAGGAASPDSPVGGEAAPAFDPEAYKSEFESRLSSEIERVNGEWQSRYQELEGRIPKAEKPVEKAEEPPKKEDYDFDKEGEFERFMDDRARYNFKMQRKEWETEISQTQSQDDHKKFVRETQDAHGTRSDNYKAANPDYDQYKNVGIPHEGVVLEILQSDYSAHIHHYLQKNPDKLKDLRGLSQSNPASAVRMVGRIEAMFESQDATAPAKKKAAGALPTAGGFGGNKPSGTVQKTDQEIFDEFHK